MAKLSEITVDVKAKLDVDRKTAETCLSLLEIYCNANNLRIREEQTEGEGVVMMFTTREN